MLCLRAIRSRSQPLQRRVLPLLLVGMFEQEHDDNRWGRKEILKEGDDIMDEKMIENIEKNDSNTFVCPDCGRVFALDECDKRYAIVDVEGVLEEADLPVCPDCHTEVVSKADYARMMKVYDHILKMDDHAVERFETAMCDIIVGYGLEDVFPPEEYVFGSIDSLIDDVALYDGLANEKAMEMCFDLCALKDLSCLTPEQTETMLRVMKEMKE